MTSRYFDEKELYELMQKAMQMGYDKAVSTFGVTKSEDELESIVKGADDETLLKSVMNSPYDRAYGNLAADELVERHGARVVWRGSQGTHRASIRELNMDTIMDLTALDNVLAELPGKGAAKSLRQEIAQELQARHEKELAEAKAREDAERVT